MSNFRFSDAVKEGRVRSHSGGPAPYITFPAFDPYPEVSALMTLRNDAWPAPTTAEKLFPAAAPVVARALGVPPGSLTAGRQVHGTKIYSLPRSNPAAPPTEELRVIPSMDGFLTNARLTGLAIFTADCLPIFLYDAARGGVIGLLHCGRNGTLNDIVGAGVQKMREDFGSEPADCLAVIGPSVGPCCYDIDLWSANERRLKRLGVPAVFNCRVCTRCNNDVFYSYRAERERSGRMVSAIALK